MAVAKKRGGFIKSSAKKWAGIRKKQALANKYLKSARENLGTNHKIYIATMNKVRMFQVKHGQSRKMTLSMESLRTGDMEIYEQLLDSIIDSTYTNPQKYEKYKEQQLDFAIEEGWAKDRKEAQEIYNFRNSDLFEQLEDIGLSDVPSKVLEKAAKYGQADMSLDDFKTMTQTFMRAYDSGDETSKTYFDYADRYLKAKKERKADFDKALQTYLDDEVEGSFLDFLNEF